jgi:hypothetical protein
MEGTTAVLHQDLHAALKLAEADAKENEKSSISKSRNEQHIYLLLSIRHILVCHTNSTSNLSYTAPMKFMDGLTPPSTSAINLLLQALAPSHPPLYTPVHKLPLEIQNRILTQVSEGPIEAARVGCLLGLGSPYTWMRSNDWPRRGGPTELLTSPTHRTEFTPVESKIYFGDDFSGVSYR